MISGLMNKWDGNFISICLLILELLADADSQKPTNDMQYPAEKRHVLFLPGPVNFTFDHNLGTSHFRIGTTGPISRPSLD
ncbi:hypothetical protein BDW67DRAFT_41518 [Aspergillus spinulosporus]